MDPGGLALTLAKTLLPGFLPSYPLSISSSLWLWQLLFPISRSWLWFLTCICFSRFRGDDFSLETMETGTDFILGGSKITADGDCIHEIKRCLLLGRKVMTNLDSILKRSDITLPKKVCIIIVKAMIFSVVMYRCELDIRLSTEESMCLNCGVGEDSWESPELQGDQTSQS